MSNFGFSPSAPKAIKYPDCPSCRAPMKLARIESSTSAVDLRTFKCDCGYSETLLVKHR
jgi:hypothetical protein